MLKVGDKVRVIDNLSFHQFNIGDIVEFVGYIDGVDRFRKFGVPQSWAMNEVDYEVASEVVNEVENKKKQGYTIIGAKHFGTTLTYHWLCDRELYDEIELEDLVLVDTKLGEQIVQVIEKKEVLNKDSIHKKVIKKVKIS